MKIALFSDIHANLPTLKTAMDDIYSRKPNAVYCLGDLVGYTISWPNEVTKFIQKKGIPVITGNYDRGVELNSEDCSCVYKTEEDKARGTKSSTYNNKVNRYKNRTYLNSLPAYLHIEFGVNGNPLNLLIVLRSPRKINEYLFEDRTDKNLLHMMINTKAQVMAFGHTHKPYRRMIEDEEGNYHHAINLGKAGKPKNEDLQSCYMILDWEG